MVVMVMITMGYLPLCLFSGLLVSPHVHIFFKGCEGKMILSPISWLFIVLRRPLRIIWEGGISKFYECLTSFSQEQFHAYFERQTQQTSPLCSMFLAHVFQFRRKGTPSPFNCAWETSKIFEPSLFPLTPLRGKDWPLDHRTINENENNKKQVKHRVNTKI